MRNIIDAGANNPGTGQNFLPVPDATVPYWRSELHEIDEYRSTEQLPAQCDIAIIGAGLSGVSMAYHLTKLYEGKKQPNIVMLEARQVCSGATGRNGGHMKIKTTTMHSLIERHGLELATEVWNHVAEQKYAVKEVVEEEDLGCEFELRRSFDVFLDQAEADGARKKYLASVNRKDSWVRDVGYVPNEFVEQVTSIHDAKAAFSVPIASFWPYKFVSQLLARLISRHGETLNLQTNTPVTGLNPTASGDVLTTPRGELKATKVILATNAYSPGLIPAYFGTIIPNKGTASHLVPQQTISPHLSNTYNISYRLPPSKKGQRVDYLNPRPNSSIVVGGGNWTFNTTAPWYNTVDDSTQLPEAHSHFRSLMQTYFKGWEDSGTGIESVWTGIQGESGDGMPHVGQVPGWEGRRWILAGWNGGGNGLIFLSAKGLAKMVVEGCTFAETGLPRLFETTEGRLEYTK